jgi:hypothetical protein
MVSIFESCAHFHGVSGMRSTHRKRFRLRTAAGGGSQYTEVVANGDPMASVELSTSDVTPFIDDHLQPGGLFHDMRMLSAGVRG